MANSIRLTRMGRKQAPFYRLVVCDSRTRRDGDYIDNLGFYNPMPDAYELNVDHAKALEWLSKGAQPTDTARSLLRTEGVLYRWHLTKGGASAEEIDSKVEEFRARRAKEFEAIKAESKAELAKWNAEKEKTASKKLKEAEASAKTEAAAAEPAAEAEATETAASEDTSADEAKETTES